MRKSRDISAVIRIHGLSPLNEMTGYIRATWCQKIWSDGCVYWGKRPLFHVFSLSLIYYITLVISGFIWKDQVDAMSSVSKVPYSEGIFSVAGSRIRRGLYAYSHQEAGDRARQDMIQRCRECWTVEDPDEAIAALMGDIPIVILLLDLDLDLETVRPHGPLPLPAMKCIGHFTRCRIESGA